MKSALNRRLAGDTIVEVLISLAVAGLVLVGATIAINNDVRSMQDQEEHAQAAEFVTSQIESLRSYTGTANISCFSYQVNAATNQSTIVPITSANEPQGTNPCMVQNDGTQATAVSEPAYTLSITPSLGGRPFTYTISATWDSILGGTDHVSMEYRTQ